jgi:Ca2+-binding EF-hand superfamily protein
MINGRSNRGKVFCLISAAIVILIVSTAYAQASNHGMGKKHDMPMFADIDLNGDGAIVAAEFYEVRGKRMAERAKAGGKLKKAASAPTFEAIDLDDDGEISPEEFATHQAEMMQKHRRGKAGKSD